LSILTKICVVVLLVLILLACPVFISQATVAPNWRYAYEQEVERGKGYMMDAKREMLAHEKTIAERDKAQADLNRLTAQKDVEISRLTASLAAWQTKSAAQENNLTSLTAKVGALQREAANFNKRNDLLASQLDEARKNINKLTNEITRVSDLLKQAEAEKARVDKLARVFQERIRELEDENEALRQSGGSARAKATGEVAAVTGEPVTGTIETVKGNYASINIGSAKGIKPKMKLIVYRGEKLVAFLRIEQVDVDEAAGIIVDRQLDPMQGDKVTNELLK